jgi:hypothetical protein
MTGLVLFFLKVRRWVGVKLLSLLGIYVCSRCWVVTLSGISGAPGSGVIHCERCFEQSQEPSAGIGVRL